MGAKIAVSTSSTRNKAATTAVLCCRNLYKKREKGVLFRAIARLPIPDFRIDQGIDHIHQKVDEDKMKGVKQ